MTLMKHGVQKFESVGCETNGHVIIIPSNGLEVREH